MIKLVVFDIGQTLVEYDKPLNWSLLSEPALSLVAKKCGYILSREDIASAIDILSKYNTRINPREYEVNSDVIFGEMLRKWNKPVSDILKVKETYYMYFRQNCRIYDDVETTLIKLKKLGIKTATLSDVAYGMDNIYALADITSIIEYIDFPITSNNTGFRKPNIKGLQILANKLNIKLSEILFVGDEEKDMLCANNAGAYSVLINRTSIEKNYGQSRTVKSLLEIIDLLGD